MNHGAGVDANMEVWPEMRRLWQENRPGISEARQAVENAGAWPRKKWGWEVARLGRPGRRLGLCGKNEEAVPWNHGNDSGEWAAPKRQFR